MVIEGELSLRLEVLSHAAAGVGSIAYGTLLLRRRESTAIHRRLAVFLVVLGAAMALRALAWGSSSTVAMRPALFFLAIFPLPMAVFYEGLLRRHLHFPAKLGFLCATLAFGVTAWTSMALTSEWWPMSLVGYHILAVAYLGSLLGLAFLREPPGPRRSLYGAGLTVSVLALCLMASDWLFLVDIDVPRLGALPVLLLLYFGGTAMHSEGKWRLRRMITRLLGVVVLAFILVALADLALRGQVLVEESLWVSVWVLTLAFMVAEPLRAVSPSRYEQGFELLVERAASIRSTGSAEVVRSLSAWPEVERVLAANEVLEQLDSRFEVETLVEAHRGVLSRASVRESTTLGSSRDLFVLDQVIFLMNALECDYLVEVGTSLLGVRFAAGPEPETYRRILQLLSVSQRRREDSC